MPDKYRSYDQLASAEAEGVAYTVVTREQSADTVIVAPHGGNIEPGTTELALAIAGTEFSCYSFVGLKPEKNSGLHITSTRFDEPRCLAMISRARRVITLHGERSQAQVLYTGGRDAQLIGQYEESLRAQGFEVAEHDNPLLQGTSARNICNQGTTGAGVQLELGRGLRAALFQSLDEQGRLTTTNVFTELVSALRAPLLEH